MIMYNATYDQIGIYYPDLTANNHYVFLVKVAEQRVFMALTDEWTYIGYFV